jgi:hypothetical protein
MVLVRQYDQRIYIYMQSNRNIILYEHLYIYIYIMDPRIAFVHPIDTLHFWIDDDEAGDRGCDSRECDTPKTLKFYFTTASADNSEYTCDCRDRHSAHDSVVYIKYEFR